MTGVHGLSRATTTTAPPGNWTNCSKFPTKIANGDVVLRLCDKMSSKCSLCGRKKYREEEKSWSYVSEGGGEVHLHVACVTDMLVEAWERQNCASRSILAAQNNITRARETAPSKLQLSLKRGGNGRNWWLVATNTARILRIVVSVVAAIFGDPTHLVFNLIDCIKLSS